MNSWSNYVGQEVAGRYRLESLLGVGSFGPVYAARDNKAQQAVMLRLLPPEIGGSSAFDATVLTDFRHPQAIAVSDVGGFEETRYVVMPRAVGQRIQLRDPWPVERVLSFVRQVSAPLIAFQKYYDLQHLHLHPGNVFVDESSGKPQFQVADLGLASQVGSGPLILAAIRERRTTPEFLSPEQLQGNVPSSQSDVYAFGAMVFQLLSGLPPFPYSGESLAAYSLHVAKAPPPRFRDVSDQLNIDSYLESIILRCLSKSPDGRHGSIKEFVESYEMAYRDFQTRTLSGLKLSQLDEPRPEEFRSETARPTASPSPTANAPTPLPASDMLPGASQNPVRNDQIPYRALPHGTDSQDGMPKGSSVSRAVLHESDAILQSVNPQLNPWSGMGEEVSKPAAPVPIAAVSPPRAESPSANIQPPPPAAIPRENVPPRQRAMGTLSPNDPQSDFDDRVATPPRRETFSAPPPFQRQQEQPREQFPSSSSRPMTPRIPTSFDQTMSPASHSQPSASVGYGGHNESNLTMQMQQDWLKSQLPDSGKRSIAPAPTPVARSKSKSSGPPKIVLVLVFAFVVGAGSALMYGRVTAQRVRKVVTVSVARKDFQKAKAAIQQVHPLARIWLDREKEVQTLLADGLEQVAERRKERDVAEAVLLTGQLDAAFAPNDTEEPLKDAKEPLAIRQEIAKQLRDEVLALATSKQLKEALERLDGDVAAAFQKVFKNLSTESSDFDAKRVKHQIFQKGLDLAAEQTNDGQHAAAFEILNTWLKRLGSDDDIDSQSKVELKERHCVARVEMTLREVQQKSRPEAIEMLDKLLVDLGGGKCALHRPAILLARGKIRLALAETKSDSVTETAQRFEATHKDFEAALSELGQQPTDNPIPPTKSEILQARAAMFVARGVWHESNVSAEKSTKPLLEAVRDFKAALADVPNLELAQRHLKDIREAAKAAAHETYKAAQVTKEQSKSDELYCRTIRQLTLVVEGSQSPDDDSLARSARLLRGLAGSSLKSPDYELGVSDLSLSVVDVSDSQIAEIGEQLAADLDSEQRIHRGRRWVAVARARLVWLIATCDQQELREKAKAKIQPVELAVRAVKALEGLIDDIDRNVVTVEDSKITLAMDRSEAWKAQIVALMDAGEFEKALSRITSAQSYLVSKEEAWQADRSAFLQLLQEDYVSKKSQYRVKPPPGVVRTCSPE